MRSIVVRMLVLAAWLLAVWPVTGAIGQVTEPTLTMYGWWNARQALPADPTGGLLPPLELPPPLDAPDDGLYVEAAASGTPLAIAAITYYTGGGVDASLTLELAAGSSPDGVTVAACPAGGGWEAAQNGRWDRRPTYDPATCTFLGTPGAETITFTIPASAHEPGSGHLTLVVVPAAGSGAFAAAFDPPTSASLVTVPATATAATPAATPEPGPVTVGGAPYAPPNALTDAVPTFATPIAAPATSPLPTSATDDEAAAPSFDVRPAITDDRASNRAVAGIVLALGAALWALTMRPQWLPRLVASKASGAAPVGPAPRGLGRFTQVRSEPPNPL